MHGIEKYRAQNWRIARVSGRASAFFSLRHVLYPASGVRRVKREMAHEKVLRMIDRLHNIWFNRVKRLITTQLWLPGNSLTRTGSVLTYRRIMHCRPSCVFYGRGNTGRLRPCRRDKFCPFCWARVAAAGYRHYKRQIRIARKIDNTLVLVCRVITQQLPAQRGLLGSVQAQNTLQLRRAIAQHCAAYRPLVKQLQRKTIGSAWRVAVNPTDTGWQVETRQLLLCSPHVRQPLVKHPGAAESFMRQISLLDDDAVFDVLGRFFEYPAGLLLAPDEQAAAAVNAEANLRTSSGTGVFRTTGQSLARQLKKDVQHGAGKNSQGVRAAEEPIRFSPDVPM